MSGQHDVELEVAALAGDGYGGVVAHDLGGDHRDALGDHGVHLARHDGGAGLHLGEGDLGVGGPRAAAEEAYVVGDLHEAHGDGLERAAGEDGAVHRALGLEVVLGLAHLDAEARAELLGYPARELGVGVDAGADGRAAEGDLGKVASRLLQAL